MFVLLLLLVVLFWPFFAAMLAFLVCCVSCCSCCFCCHFCGLLLFYSVAFVAAAFAAALGPLSKNTQPTTATFDQMFVLLFFLCGRTESNSHRRACANTAPSSSAAPGGASPDALRALRKVMSTANWAPLKHGRSCARTSHRHRGRPSSCHAESVELHPCSCLTTHSREHPLGR